MGFLFREGGGGQTFFPVPFLMYLLEPTKLFEKNDFTGVFS